MIAYAPVFKKVPPAKLRRLLRIPLVSGLVRKKLLRGLGLDAARLTVSGSAPTTRPGTALPSASETSISDAPRTTWLLVTM